MQVICFPLVLQLAWLVALAVDTSFDAADKPTLPAGSLPALERSDPAVDSLTTPELIDHLKTGCSQQIRQTVLLLRSRGLAPSTAMADLNEILESRDWYVRFWFAYHLRDTGNDRTQIADRLAATLSLPNADIRQTALEMLAKLEGDSERFSQSLRRALEDQSREVRQSAARLLCYRSDERDIPLLIRALTDVDPAVRGYASVGLARIGKPAVTSLQKALTNPDRDVRASAAYALGQIGAPARPALPVLQKLCSENDKYVRYVAESAVRKIRSGQKVSLER